MSGFDGTLINADTTPGNIFKANANIPTNRLEQRTFQPFVVPWESWRVFDAFGTLLPATAASDDLGLVGGTHGTDTPTIQTSDAASTSVTQKARVTVALPAEYDDAASVRLRFSAAMQTVSDTSATLDVSVFESDKEGGVGSDLYAGAAQDINSATWTDYDFSLTDSGLVAGDVLDVLITVAITDSATGANVIAEIGYVALQVDTRG